MGWNRLPLVLLVSGVLCYALVSSSFTYYMAQKPVEEKLGYVPSIKLIKPLSADQKEFAAASLIMKAVMYFGGIVDKAQKGNVIKEPPELQGMSRLLHGAVQLDPYNMDAYYFAQGFLTWDVKQFKVANDLLDYGMKYRTWDWYLPFFAGFNSAFFLKGYDKAATYYQKAAELSGMDLHKRLAGRYMQESGHTDLAIIYLSTMEKGENNPAIRKLYKMRLKAYREVRRIEVARDRFRKERGKLSFSLDELLSEGYLNPAPVDPYGGRFLLDQSGKVTSTSGFLIRKSE